MPNPIIATAGTTGGFLLITDQNRLVHRIPKEALCEIVDSSNARVLRLDLCLPNKEITLLFETALVRDNFLTVLDTHY